MKARLAAMEAEAAKLREVGVSPLGMDPKSRRPALAGLTTFTDLMLPRKRLHACCTLRTAPRSENWWCCVLCMQQRLCSATRASCALGM